MAEILVPITYSSVHGEDGKLQPSKLSMMVADAAERFVLPCDHVMIAGEQAHGADAPSTGDLLAPQFSEAQTVTSLHNKDNFLINTSFQVEALVEELDPRDVMMVVALGFHIRRLKKSFMAYNGTLENVSFVEADSVLRQRWGDPVFWDGDVEAMDHAFQQRYGFNEGVNWAHVEEAGLASFARRERLTHATLLTGDSGWLIKAVSRYRKGGRLDDLDADGNAVMQDTGENRLPGFIQALSSRTVK